MEQDLGDLADFGRAQADPVPEAGAVEGADASSRQPEELLRQEARQGYDLICESISRHLTYQGESENFDIYERRLTAEYPPQGFDVVPYCLYFYYVRVDNDGRITVDHYFYPNGPLDEPENWSPIPYEAVPGLIQQLAINARPRTKVKNPPPLDRQDFQPMPYRRKCYIAIFFDEQHWHFHRREMSDSTGEPKPSVAFNPLIATPNHTFFDACDIAVEMPKSGNPKPGQPTTDNRSAIYFVNHMTRNAAGDPLGDESQHFKFDMWLKVSFARNPHSSISINIDPGETNTGPPLGPP